MHHLHLIKWITCELQGVAQLAYDHGLHLEVVGSKLHYHTGATGEFTRLPSRLGGISPAQMVGNPPIAAAKKKKLGEHVGVVERSSCSPSHRNHIFFIH